MNESNDSVCGIAKGQMHAEDTDDLNDVSGETSKAETLKLGQQLEHNLAALFLKMHTVLYIPKTSVQEIIQQLCEIVQLSWPLLYSKVKAV